MRRRRIIIIFAFCAVAAIGVIKFRPAEREPEYNGKKLSEWLGRKMRVNGDTEDAVRAMGTNALPQLVIWLDYERPAWQYELMRTGWKISPHLWNKFYGDDLKVVRMNNAVWAFNILGPRAAPARPGLVHIMKTGRKSSAETAAYVLGGLGEEAVPVLLEILTNRQSFPSVRPAIVATMIRRPLTNGAVLVPELTADLTSPNPKLRASAATILGKLRAAPHTVVPRLAELVQDKDGNTQYRAIEALEDFGTNARPAVPALLPLLSDSDSSIRAAATNALSAIAPEVLTDAFSRTDH